MADIDQIIAGGAKTNADFDFGKLNRSYWQGRDEFAKNDLRDAFKDGLPMKGDQPDWPTIAQTFFKKGAVDQGIAAAGQGLAQQKMEYGQRIGEQAFPSETAQPQIVSPPSANRTASTVVAPPLNKGGVQAQGAPQGAGGETPKSYLTKLGLQPGYNMEVGLAAFKRNGIEPDQPFNPNDPNLAKVMPAMQRMGSIGQVQPPQPGDNQPPQGAPQQAPVMAQPQAAPQAQPDFNQRFSAARPGGDPTLGGLVPAGRTPQQQIDGLTRAIGSNMLTPEVAKTYQSRIDAITKAIELTTDQKNAAAAGQSVADYQSKGAEAAAQLAIMKENILPELKDSLKTAKASKDEIQAIHRSREQLDAAGGIFSGSKSDVRLKMAKFGELFGVPNADKIANTEVFSAAIGGRVLAMIKALGANPSNSDRIFAEKIAGGDPNLDEASIRRILDIGEKAARVSIDSHNTTAAKFIKSNEALQGYSDVYRVEAPGQYERPKGAGQPKQGAKPAGPSPTFGSKADLHAAISSGKLKKGDSFIGGDGVERFVP